MSYCIDTSALIDAAIRWYPPDVFPSLWTRVEALIETGRLISSEEVLLELEQKEGDILHEWAKNATFAFYSARRGHSTRRYPNHAQSPETYRWPYWQELC
jgi:hypothetical protein